MLATPPAYIVVGHDELIESVCRNLVSAGGSVTVVWDPQPGLRERLEACGARFAAGSPRDADMLRAAGIGTAQAILVLDENDRLNLEVVLAARAANPDIRIVMRQFNRSLAGKIEQNLRNCSVVSLSAHSAATFAAAAVEANCFLGIEFPTGSRSLVGFSRRSASEVGVVGLALAGAEQLLQCRILSSNGVAPAAEQPFSADDALILFGPIEQLAQVIKPLKTSDSGFGWVIARIRAIVSEFDPLLRVLALLELGVFLAATVFFGIALHLNPISAAYFVTTTMTTVGYGDIALSDKGPLLQAADILLMIFGLVVANLAIAFVAAALVRGQWNALQGLRPVRHSGHILVFGAGTVGTRVIDYLCELQAVVTVVEKSPSAELVGRAREHDITLLTGNATLDETLNLSNIGEARCAVVVTDNDATNLEIGLGARARQAGIPVIMRVAQPSFAAAIRDQFEIRRAFSATALATSLFSDLAVSKSARGRVTFGDSAFRLEEHPADTTDRSATPIAAVAENGHIRAVSEWNDVTPADTVLTMEGV